MRVRGRRLYPDTLQERRLLMALGGTPLYAPRGVSPYAIARRLMRTASNETPDIQVVREMLASRLRRHSCASSGERPSETDRAPDPVAA
jgi:hypothetical protein